MSVLSHALLELIYRSGLVTLGKAAARRSLTVLAYHRVAAAAELDSATFLPGVSASPAAFARQMDYVRRHFSVVSLATVDAWVRGESSLPARPALITFDDGYLDNMTHALPVLKDRGLPATIFLATDYVGASEPFYWDLAAHRFAGTGRQGEGGDDRELRAWIKRLKQMRPKERREALAIEPEDEFTPVHLTWDNLRHMLDNGFSVGAHTCSHVVLSRLTPGEMAREINGSVRAIGKRIGEEVISFAYPNGLAGDFDATSEELLKAAGIRLAFTLLPGPARLPEVRERPLAIRRIHIGPEDNLPRFAAKLMGWGRAFAP